MSLLSELLREEGIEIPEYTPATHKRLYDFSGLPGEEYAYDPDFNTSLKRLATIKARSDAVYDAPEVDTRSNLEKIADFLSTGQYVSANVAGNLLGQSDKSIGEDILAGLQAGISDKGKKGNYQDILQKSLGLANTGNMNADIALNMLRETAGSALNIFGDPTTYATFGMGKAGKVGAEALKEAEIAAKVFTPEGAQQAAKLVGVPAERIAADAAGAISLKPPIWLEGGKLKYNIPFVKESEGYKGLTLLPQETLNKTGLPDALDAIASSTSGKRLENIIGEGLTKDILANKNPFMRALFKPAGNADVMTQLKPQGLEDFIDRGLDWKHGGQAGKIPANIEIAPGTESWLKVQQPKVAFDKKALLKNERLITDGVPNATIPTFTYNKAKQAVNVTTPYAERTILGNVAHSLGKTFVPDWQMSGAIKQLYHGENNQKAFDDSTTMDIVNKIVKDVPSKDDRIAIARHIDAPGRYQIAPHLVQPTAEIKALLDTNNLGSFASQEADLNMLNSTVDQYMAHFYEFADKPMRKQIDTHIADVGVAIRQNDRNAIQRTINSFDDAISAGLVPKLDAAEIIGLRIASAQKAMRGKKFVEQLKTLGDDYVRDMYVPKHMEIPLAKELQRAVDSYVPTTYKTPLQKYMEIKLKKNMQNVNPETVDKAIHVANMAQAATEVYRKYGYQTPRNITGAVMDLLQKRGELADLTHKETMNIVNNVQDVLDTGIHNPEGFIRADDLFLKNPTTGVSANPLPNKYISDEVARMLLQEFKPMYQDNFTRTVDAITNAWKKWVTFDLTFHTRNILGNVFNNMLSGMGIDKAHLYLDALMIQLGKKNVKLTTPHGILTAEEILDGAKRSKTLDSGLMGAEVAPAIRARIKAAAVTGLRKLQPFNASRSVGTFLENNARLAHYMNKLSEGYSSKYASESVKKYLFDYGELTNTERDVFKRIFPFYTWTRKNFALQLGEAMHKPGRVAMFGKGKDYIEQNNTEKTYTPKWLQDKFTVNVGDKIFIPDTPMNDLGKFGIDTLIAGSRPDIKEALQLSTNKDFYFKNDIIKEGLLDDPELQTKKGSSLYNLPILKQILGAKIVTDPYTGEPRTEINATASHIINQFARPVKTYDKLMDSSTNPLQKLTNLVSPVSIYTPDRKREAYYDMMQNIARYEAILQKLSPNR